MVSGSPSPAGAVRRLACALAALGALGAFAGAAGAQQRGPIQLFPDLSPTRPAPIEREAPVTAPAPGDPALERPASPATEQDRPAPVLAPAAPVHVEGLDAPDVGVIGLEQGFDLNIWRGSDAQIVLDLLAHLPVQTRNPAVRDLTRRLLITGAALEGDVESGRLLQLRVDRLIAMGQLDDAAALLDRLPARGEDSSLARQAAEVALWRGDEAQACALAEQIAPASNHPFWARLVVVCRLQTGDVAGAMLGLDLLRDAGQTEDAAFFELVDMTASGDLGRPLPELAAPSPLHIAMLRQAGLPLPESALASPSRALIAAVARTPALAPGRELEMAEAAFHAGVLSADELARRYLELGSAEPPIGTAAGAGPEARARARAQLRELDPTAQAVLLEALWRGASGADRILIGRAFVDVWSDLPVADELLFAAPVSARALLAADRPVEAVRWFSLLQGVTAGQGGAAGVTPLFSLAGIGGRAQVPQPDLESLVAWRSGAQQVTDSGALHLYSLLEGVGVRVPTRAWWDLLDVAADGPGRAPLAPYWRALDHAQTDRRFGEALLLALHVLGGDDGEIHPEALIRSLRALRAVGLEGEARAIAVADAIAQDL